MGNASFALHGEAELGNGGEIELGNGGEAELCNGGDTNEVSAADMVEASHDMTKLQRALFAGGVGQSAAALSLALFRSPAGLFLRNNVLFNSYYGVLVAVADGVV